MNIDLSIVASFAPAAILRASINLGNPILAKRDPRSGELVGVSVDLARVRERLMVRVVLVRFGFASSAFIKLTAFHHC